MTHLDTESLTDDGAAALRDRFGRPLRDLRISVTDRCNFRCQYCMPKEVFGPNFAFLPRDEILAFEEITRLTRLFVEAGTRKVRLTGGEPLLRAELATLVGMLKDLRDIEVTVTTNGTLLASQAEALRAAGLDRVTVSLDSLDDPTFRAMNDMNFPVALVLEGIEAAVAAGFEQLKVNAVVRRGINDDSILDLARHFRGTPHILRFIEFMDVGTTNGWRLDEVVPASEVAQLIGTEFPLEPVDPNYEGEVARRYRYTDGSGEIGLITSVTQPFCATCTRARLSAEGKLYTCLFAVEGSDLREAMRSGASDDDLRTQIAEVWGDREDRYSELRSEATTELPRIEMSYIGG